MSAAVVGISAVVYAMIGASLGGMLLFFSTIAALLAPKGDSGPPGLKGIPGKQGQIGQPGRKGTLGLKGDKGDMGDMGLRGAMGPMGIPGTRGIAATGTSVLPNIWVGVGPFVTLDDSVTAALSASPGYNVLSNTRYVINSQTNANYYINLPSNPATGDIIMVFVQNGTLYAHSGITSLDAKSPYSGNRWFVCLSATGPIWTSVGNTH